MFTVGTFYDLNGAHIKLRIAGKELMFSRRMDEALAPIVSARVEEEINRRIENIRKTAYSAGKRAARGGPKVHEFNNCPNSLLVGWTKDEFEEVRGNLSG